MFIRTESFKEFIRFYPFVSAIVAINLVLWLMTDMLALPGSTQLLQLGVGVNALIDQGEYWRLITPIFLHGGLTHLLFNCFALVIFGPALERMLGRFKFVLVYLFTGIAGNFFTYFMNPEAFYAHLGASGAIYGMLGLYLFMVVFRKELIDPSSAQIVIVILVIGLIMTFLRPGINIASHVFGFIAGVASGPVILHNVRPFSSWGRPRRTRSSDGIGFDPDRWKKRRFSLKKIIVPVIWGFLILLIIFGLLSSIL